MSIKGWNKLCAVMPPAPDASAIRDVLSRRVDELDENGIKIGNLRSQEFLSGFVPQPGGKFVATYVTDNLQDIIDANNEPSILILFVQDLGNGLHLGERYVYDNSDPPVRSIEGTAIYTPHPTYETFIAGGLSKAEAFRVNEMLGTP